MNHPIPRTRWYRIIIPILVICIISFMDRVNISFALPGGLAHDLAIKADLAGIVTGIFFIGYLFLQIPGGRIAVNGSGKRFVAYAILAWAILSCLTGLITQQYQLIILRFFLGVAEGGMFPVVLTIVSNWFPENELGRANGVVMMFAPLGGIFTAPVSGFIIELLNWRWLFIIEGLFTVLMLFFWCFLMSDRPQEARWLPKAEKEYLINQLEKERIKKNAQQNTHNPGLKEVFKNKGLVRLILLNFFYQTGDYGFTLWLPSLLKNLTGRDMGSIGLLSMVPFFAMLLGIYVVTLLSDKHGKRRFWIRVSLLCFAASLLIAVQLNEYKTIACIALICCGFFVKAATGPMWSTPGRLASAEVAGNARGVINGLGNLGGFFGPWLVGTMLTYFNQSVAISVLAGSLIIAALISLSLPAECDLTPDECQRQP